MVKFNGGEHAIGFYDEYDYLTSVMKLVENMRLTKSVKKRMQEALEIEQYKWLKANDPNFLLWRQKQDEKDETEQAAQPQDLSQGRKPNTSAKRSK